MIERQEKKKAMFSDILGSEVVGTVEKESEEEIDDESYQHFMEKLGLKAFSPEVLKKNAKKAKKSGKDRISTQ